MKINNAITLASTFLGKEYVADYVDSGLTETENGSDAKDCAETMLKCANTVINELSLTYFPMSKTEKATATDGKFYYTALSEKIIEIKSVIDSEGVSVSYKINAEYISCDRNEIYIEYCYVPKEYSFGDEAGFSAKVPVRLVAYGIASEYSLIARRFSESVMWRKRFQSAIAELFKPKNVVARKRSWV